MLLIQQSTTTTPLPFLMVSSTDHITGQTGLSPTVFLSKNGASGVSAAGAISAIDGVNLPGWYQVAGNATDTNTLGSIMLHASGAGADPSDFIVAQIVSFNPYNANLGLTNVSSNLVQINGSSNGVAGLSNSTSTICWGTASGGSTTSVNVSTLNNPSSLTNPGQLIGRTLIFLGATTTAALQSSAATITGSTAGATPTITVSALDTSPANGDTFAIL